MGAPIVLLALPGWIHIIEHFMNHIMVAKSNICCHGNIVVNLDVLGVNGNDTRLKEEVFAHLRKDMMTNNVLRSFLRISNKGNPESLLERNIQG